MRSGFAGLAGIVLTIFLASAASASGFESGNVRLDYQLSNWDLPSAPQYLRFQQAMRAGDDDDGGTDSEAETEKPKRETWHQLDVRYRRLSVPDAVLDSFYDTHEHVSGQAIGADYTAVKATGFNIIISGDYSTVTAPDGPWQESGSNDLDWTEVNLQFISGDLTVAYELRLPASISILFGTGLGFGVVTGDITTYEDETGPTGARTEEDYPTVMPVVNVQVSPRLVIINKLVLQADIGFRNALYGGLSAGLRF